MRIRTAVRSNKAMAVVGAAALMLAASACSSSNDDSKAPSAKGPAKGTITWYANQFGPTDTDVRTTLVKAFEKDNPGITVKVQSAPSNSDTFRSTLTTQISGGSSSFDVYNGDVVWPAQFASKSLALPLNSYFSKDYWKTFSPGLVSSLTYQGKIMAAPLFSDNAFLFYRKDLLAKAHLPVPTTWEQLQSEAKKLQQQKLVKYGFAGQFASYEGLTADFTEFEADAGGSTLNSDGSKSTINSPAALKALTYMRGLVSSGVAPSSVTNFQEQQSETLFTSGQVAFLRNWTYAYADSNSSASKVNGKVGIANLPSFDGTSGPGYSTTGGWNIYVNPHSKHIAADIAFVKWMTGEKAQKIMGINGGEIPVNAAALADPDVQKSNPAYPVAAHNKLAARPSTAAEYSQVSDAIYSNINAAISGSASPKDALSKADKAITTALGSNGL